MTEIISSSGGWKCKVKVSAGFFFSEVSLLINGYLLVSSHGLASVLVCVLIPSSYKDTWYIRLGSTHLVLFYLNYLFKGLISRYSHILRSWGLRLQYINLVGRETVLSIAVMVYELFP